MDLKLLFLINHEWTNPFLDRFMALMSSFAAWTPLLVVVMALAAWRGGFRARAFFLTAALIVLINDAVISNSIKHLVHRPRPFQTEEGVRMVDLARKTPRILAIALPASVKISDPTTPPGKSGRSFPSSHTVNTIAVALVTACFYRRYGWLSFLPALLVAYSRIYTGSHWPSDVLISLFLGVGTTLLLLVLLAWLWRTKGGRYLPRIHQQNPELLPA